MSDDDSKLDRRQFLKRAGLAGLAATGAGSLLTGCDSKGGSTGSGSKAPSGNEDKKQAANKGGSKGPSCPGTSDLSESDIQSREALNYVDKSDKPDKNCANCQLFKPDDMEGECGGCPSVPGPIHPEGYCTAWVKKA